MLCTLLNRRHLRSDAGGNGGCEIDAYRRRNNKRNVATDQVGLQGFSVADSVAEVLGIEGIADAFEAEAEAVREFYDAWEVERGEKIDSSSSTNLEDAPGNKRLILEEAEGD